MSRPPGFSSCTFSSPKLLCSTENVVRISAVILFSLQHKASMIKKQINISNRHKLTCFSDNTTYTLKLQSIYKHYKADLKTMVQYKKLNETTQISKQRNTTVKQFIQVYLNMSKTHNQVWITVGTKFSTMLWNLWYYLTRQAMYIICTVWHVWITTAAMEMQQCDLVYCWATRLSTT